APGELAGTAADRRLLAQPGCGERRGDVLQHADRGAVPRAGHRGLDALPLPAEQLAVVQAAAAADRVRPGRQPAAVRGGRSDLGGDQGAEGAPRRPGWAAAAAAVGPLEVADRVPGGAVRGAGDAGY